ncbi:DUF192 domain-containing protein [Xanthobacter sp. TB0139]|uniref:DUF192 domain-containing protein n=1 Tax=Xanthobacter sp. TB0139 TaxID=3459178 RepID=UPI00403974FE
MRPSFSRLPPMQRCLKQARLLMVSGSLLTALAGFGLSLPPLLAPLPAHAEAPAKHESQMLTPLEPAEVVTRKGVVMLEMEVARTDEERTRGLMYRKSLPERHGMMFDFGYDQPIYMWMKNTYIPLDMLFIRSDGTIARIEEMTTPFSTRTISSGAPARVVIELAGGSSRRLGIAAGDKVAHPVFRKP